jgi:hypothetical protein
MTEATGRSRASRTVSGDEAATTDEASKDASAGDGGTAEMEAKFDEANEKGYWGTVPDGPPNEAYTVTGQASGEAARHDARLGAPIGDAGDKDADK